MPKASAMPTVPPCFLSIICGHTLEIRCFEGWGAPVLLHTLFFSPPTMGIDPIGEIVSHIIWIEQLFLDLYPTCFSKCHTCVVWNQSTLSKINTISEATHSRLVVPQSGNPMMLGTGRSDMSILNINCWGIYTYTDPSIYDRHLVYIQSNITRHLKTWHLCKYRCSKFPNIAKITGLGNNNTDQSVPLDETHRCWMVTVTENTMKEWMITGGTTVTLGNLHIYDWGTLW